MPGTAKRGWLQSQLASVTLSYIHEAPAAYKAPSQAVIYPPEEAKDLAEESHTEQMGCFRGRCARAQHQPRQGQKLEWLT